MRCIVHPKHWLLSLFDIPKENHIWGVIWVWGQHTCRPVTENDSDTDTPVAKSTCFSWSFLSGENRAVPTEVPSNHP